MFSSRLDRSQVMKKLEIGHDRLSLDQTAKGAVLDVIAEVQDAHHGERLTATLAGQGMRVRVGARPAQASAR